MLLEMREVVKHYRRGGEDVVALAGVDLSVDPGELVALIGPSGSGKSTLLQLAGGLDVPDGGSVVVAGRDLARLSVAERARARRRQIGFVFQFFHLLPTLTVAENVELPLLLDRRRNRRSRVRALLERVGVDHRAGHLPSELSGGEMQRAAIARALVAQPELLLADEPTGNLDSATGAAVLALLTEVVAEAGTALLMVTHDGGAAALADRVLHLRDGCLDDAAPAPAAVRPVPRPAATAPAEPLAAAAAEPPAEPLAAAAAEPSATPAPEPPATPAATDGGSTPGAAGGV